MPPAPQPSTPIQPASHLQQTALQQQLLSAIGSKEESSSIDPSQLMFKTMPKGFDIPKNYVKPAMSSRPSLAGQPLGQPTGSSTGHPNSGMQPPRPMPSAPYAQAPQQSKPQNSSKGVWIAIIIILILLVIGGVWYFMFYNKSTNTNTSTTPTAQNANSQSATANTSASSGQTASGAVAATPATPAASQIDPAWLQKYFAQYLVDGVCPPTAQSICGDSADPDNDGLTNLQEFKDGTNPTVADTDGVGIADGDAVNIFNLDPTTAHTAGNPKYTDAQDLKNKYNSRKNAPFTDADLVQIAANIAEFHLHQPTIDTLGSALVNFYTSYQSTSPSASTSQSTTAQETQPSVTPNPPSSSTQPSQ
jgi:hypothetical protein